MAPVVTAALGGLGPLLGKLTDMLASECGRLKGVRCEIRSLRSEFTCMHGALKKYATLEKPDDQVKEWISLVRELAYDTEDCFDNFIHHLGEGGQHAGLKEFFRKLACCLTLRPRYGIANEIDDLKLRIKEVKELRTSYKVDDIACSTSNQADADPRLSARFAEKAHLVGIEESRDHLANWMVEEHENKNHLRVMSIVGSGGSGKTTLANEISRKIQGHFTCRAFVSVSQKPDLKTIAKDVIYQVPYPDGFTKDIDTWDDVTSIAKLRELLQDKRYLVIIDDVWSKSAWNDIRCAFPDNSCFSRIIATTRIIDVARSCRLAIDDCIYEMEPLSPSESKRLFFKKNFGSENGCPDMLKEASEEILKKCGGLPLAIVSMSSLLASTPIDKQEWEKVKKSVGSDLGKNQSLERINIILSLSYNVLSPNLKTCLLYLSNFPEDCVIDRERLLRRWIAEGFISEERGQSRQDVAEKYFYELINKNMIQPVDIGYDGKARACRVHDMMHELIISKSAAQNFVTVVDGEQTVLTNHHGFIRRLSVQHIDQELASVLANEDLGHVRSLTSTTSGCIRHLPSLVKFKALRTLDFEGCQGLEEYDMNGMEKLFQLKYLSFRDTGVSKLPSGVVMLHDLETLDLRNTHIEELPAGIVQLSKLQHLLTASGSLRDRFRNGNTKIPNGMKNMSNLRVISGFNITMSSVGAVEELGNLTNLNELHIQLDDGNKRHQDVLLSSLCKLLTCKLQCLWISSDYSVSTPLQFLDSWSIPPTSLQIFGMTTNYHFTRIPKWIGPSLTSLAYLLILLTKVTPVDLHILGDLPALLYLELWFEEPQTETLAVQGRGFRCLKEFHFRPSYPSRGSVGCLVFEEEALPKVEKLKLPFFVLMAKPYGYCLGIIHLPCLRVLEVTLLKRGSTSYEIEDAHSAIRNEANAHPKRPSLAVFNYWDAPE